MPYIFIIIFIIAFKFQLITSKFKSIYKSNMYYSFKSSF